MKTAGAIATAGLRWAWRSTIIAVGTLLIEVLAAILRPVPHQPEFDASGVVGDGEITQRWLVLGDSSSTAPGVPGPDDIWVRQLARARCGRGAIEITSLAAGGRRARDVRDDQLPLIDPTRRYDIVFVSVGANDVLKAEPIDRYGEALDEIVGRLSLRHGLVVMSGVGDLSTIPRLLWPLDWMVGRRARRFDDVAARIAGRRGAMKVDHWRETASAFRHDPSIFSPDHLHPGPSGHAVWAEAVDRLLSAGRA